MAMVDFPGKPGLGISLYQGFMGSINITLPLRWLPSPLDVAFKSLSKDRDKWPPYIFNQCLLTGQGGAVFSQCLLLGRSGQEAPWQHGMEQED
jgi:hypothetical protein